VSDLCPAKKKFFQKHEKPGGEKVSRPDLGGRQGFKQPGPYTNSGPWTIECQLQRDGFAQSVLDPSTLLPAAGAFIFTAVEYSINT
jgi:hypothetical protein